MDKNMLKIMVAAIAFIFASGVCASPWQVNAVYDAPDADLTDGICADAQGMCTLRAAVDQANATDSITAIFLQAGEIYRLDSTLTITGAIHVFGHLSDTLTLEAPIITAADGVAMRIMEINAPGKSVALRSVRITGGLVRSSGGGGIGGAGIRIRQGSEVYLDKVEVVGNIADRLDGGGIYNDGRLTIRQSNISDNQVMDYQAGNSPQLYYGGGLANVGTATIIASSFINNNARLGGAIAARRGAIDEFGPTTTEIQSSTIMHNRASFDGTAIYSAFSDLKIFGSTIVENGLNTQDESIVFGDSPAAISTPFGDAAFDPSITGNATAGAALYVAHCSSCHSSRPIQANRYAERPLFAYIDSLMGPRSGCSGACAQKVTTYLKSDLYEPAANTNNDIIFAETPGTYIATSIVVNTGDISEFKKGLSTPISNYTLWGEFPAGADITLNDFSRGFGYGFPGQLTWQEENALEFELLPSTSQFTGINTVVAKPVAGTDVWRESIQFSLCKDVAQRHNLYSYNLSPYCKHGESAGNYGSGYRANIQSYTYGSHTFSIGAWEDNRSN